MADNQVVCARCGVSVARAYELCRGHFHCQKCMCFPFENLFDDMHYGKIECAACGKWLLAASAEEYVAEARRVCSVGNCKEPGVVTCKNCGRLCERHSDMVLDFYEGEKHPEHKRRAAVAKKVAQLPVAHVEEAKPEHVEDVPPVSEKVKKTESVKIDVRAPVVLTWKNGRGEMMIYKLSTQQLFAVNEHGLHKDVSDEPEYWKPSFCNDCDYFVPCCDKDGEFVFYPERDASGRYMLRCIKLSEQFSFHKELPRAFASSSGFCMGDSVYFAGAEKQLFKMPLAGDRWKPDMCLVEESGRRLRFIPHPEEAIVVVYSEKYVGRLQRGLYFLDNLKEVPRPSCHAFPAVVVPGKPGQYKLVVHEGGAEEPWRMFNSDNHRFVKLDWPRTCMGNTLIFYHEGKVYFYNDADSVWEERSL